tara:strand:+ start:8382 stop:9476 length:1095 start_codon:yes stop_codon:yes gene_type:complete
MYPRLSFFGLGRVWFHYARLLKKFYPDFSPFLLVDVDRCAIRRAKELFPDSHCCLRDDPTFNKYLHLTDLGLILTPSGDHYSTSKFLLEKGISVLSEKPSTLIPQQTLDLSDIAKRNNLFYGCVFQNRNNSAVRFAKTILNSGRLGRILNCDINLFWSRDQEYYDDGWHGTWGMDGGVISQQAIHHLDTARYLCGEVASVVGIGTKFANHLEADDSFKAILQFQSGAFGSLFATTALARKDLEASITITGRNGQICIGGVCLNKIESLYLSDDSETYFDSSSCNEVVENGYGNGHVAILEALLNLNHSQQLFDYSEYLMNHAIWPKPSDFSKTIQLVSSLYASWECETWVNLQSGKISSRLGIV